MVSTHQIVVAGSAHYSAETIMNTCPICKKDSETGSSFKVMTAAIFTLKYGANLPMQNNQMAGLYFKDFLPIDFWVCESCIRIIVTKTRPSPLIATLFGIGGAILTIGAVFYPLLFQGELLFSIVIGIIGIALISQSIIRFMSLNQYKTVGNVDVASFKDVLSLVISVTFSGLITYLTLKQRGEKPDPKLVEDIHKEHKYWDWGGGNWVYWDYDTYIADPVKLDANGKFESGSKATMYYVQV